jgi:prepilin peptidase CpaA
MFCDAVLAVYAGLLAWAALSDALRLRIPNRVPIALLAIYPLYLLSNGTALADLPGMVLPALGLALMCFLIGFVLFARNWMGGGDVKLISVCALWAGPALIPEFLIITSLVGGVQAMASVLRLPTLVMASLPFSVPQLAPASAATTVEGTQGVPQTRKRTLPYGIAIAAGGLYVAGRLAGIIAA